MSEQLAFNYTGTSYTDLGFTSNNEEIRRDLPEAYRKAWQIIARPGNWWTGQDRVAIAAESRRARTCDLCVERKAALSPFSVSGEHDVVTNLPPVAIDAVHRIVTDASRLTQSWLEQSYAEGMSDGRYVELLGIVVAVVSIDGFHRAMGLPLEPLPEPVAGEPSGYRPGGASDMGAWVPMLAPEKLTQAEADIYGHRPQAANVFAAMSLVPDSVRLLGLLGAVQYLPPEQVTNPTANGGRALTRPQIELLAGRVSALSDCFY